MYDAARWVKTSDVLNLNKLQNFLFNLNTSEYEYIQNLIWTEYCVQRQFVFSLSVWSLLPPTPTTYNIVPLQLFLSLERQSEANDNGYSGSNITPPPLYL